MYVCLYTIYPQFILLCKMFLIFILNYMMNSNKIEIVLKIALTILSSRVFSKYFNRKQKIKYLKFN